MHSFHSSSKVAMMHPHPMPVGKGWLETFSGYQHQKHNIILNNLFFDKKQASGLQIREQLQNNPMVDAFLSMFSSVAFLLDISSNTYVYLSSNIETMVGYTSTELQQIELTSNAALTHEEDSPYMLSLTTQLFKHLKKLPLQKLGDYTLNREFRLIRKDGSSIGMLEQSKVIETGKKGEVLSIFGQLTDVSNLRKKQGPAAYISSTFNEEIIDFSLKKSHSIFSNRELQVMELLSKGLSSKQIAGMLCISPYTVGKHRQKMLAKTQSKNSSELIHFAEHHQLV
ncbi:PAS domain-containing protein [Rhodocytophaga rosea]|uniref:PAS domain-containing protein n=1 Tax=Rhodocytophaga rosea TaxID=2704465 RepID=A0A6C0GE73_9BACT|nr:LuxR C-terminal-related transcriptional regulator [Rhodocytophaga rosea]QHT66275.1 PAS domain-containing protein [Rhodocytophaga rosea]